MEPDASGLIAALDALMIVIGPEGPAAIEPRPSWFGQFGVHRSLADCFPFLEIFFEGDAGWSGSPGSEVWTQRDESGEERVLEAIPLLMDGRRLLLVRRPGREFDQRRGELQMARDRGLAREALERVNQLKTDFLSSMNHELRAPLNAIAGFSTLLLQERSGPLTVEQQSFAREIRSATAHMAELINEALDLARIEAGQIVLKKEQVETAEMIREVAAALKPLAQEKKIAIEISPDALADDETAVWVDRRRFRQILYNLLSNAIKFTPEGGRVTTDCVKLPEGWVSFSVADTGSGIRPEDQALVFEPFYQVENTSGGAGLGLAITQRLVKDHGGNIRLRSEAGQGSVFTVELPAYGA